MRTIRKAAAVVILASSAFGAYAADTLTGKDGLTLYTFDADSAGRSACNDGCIAVWPAARPGDAKGANFGEMTRRDGTQQLTYAGKPLYYYVNDTKAGDRYGDNVQRIWHVALPSGEQRKAVSAPMGYGYGSSGY